VKSANVRKIMKERIELAAKAGCHAVDPDNTDGFVGPSLSLVRYVDKYGSSSNLPTRAKNKMALVIPRKSMQNTSIILPASPRPIT